MRTSERDRSTGLVGVSSATSRPATQTTVQADIRIGRTDYVQLSPGIRVLGARWVRTTFPAGTIGPFGVLGQVSPLDTLALDQSVRGLRVETVGPATVDGRATTKLLVSVPGCGAAVHGHGVRQSLAPTEVWVDNRHRLVQARAVTHIAASGLDDVVDEAVVPGLLGGQVVIPVDVERHLLDRRPLWWAMISDMRWVRARTSRSWISMSLGAPRVPAEPWWIMMRALGRANRFPAAPPHRIMAAADIPMPTQMVDTSGATCCMTS
jgi:hypothetical protein